MANKRKVIFIVLAGVIGATVWLFAGRQYNGRSGTFEAIFPDDVRTQFLLRFDHMESPPDPHSLCFTLDNEGRPFLLVGNTLIGLARLDDEEPLPVEVPALGPIGDFAWMPGGAILMVKDDVLGELTGEGFKQIQALPDTGMKVEPAARGLCYLYGGDSADQACHVYLYRRGGERLHLLRTDTAIKAVRGNGETTYVAIGDTVYVLAPGQDMAPVFQSSGSIESFALGPQGSFVYTTVTIAVYIDPSGKSQRFLQGTESQAYIHGEALFLFFPDLGVMQCTSVSAFAHLIPGVASQTAKERVE